MTFVVVFLSPNSEMLGFYFKVLFHDRFLPHPTQFLLHQSPYNHPALFAALTNGIIKLTIQKSDVSITN
jgi:hypothetical protein